MLQYSILLAKYQPREHNRHMTKRLGLKFKQPNPQKVIIAVVTISIIVAVITISVKLLTNPALLTQVSSINAISNCPSTTIWNGTICKAIIIQNGTNIIGLDSAIGSRGELDEIERNFIRRNYLNFPEVLFTPDTQQKGQQIQDIRLANLKQIGTDYERTWEIIMSRAAYDKLNSNRANVGTDPISMLIHFTKAENVIWANSLPKINRQAVLKRIMIVDQGVLSKSGGGWTVINDHTFGYWANDKLNGIKGFIPYDIDSRWAFDDSWGDFYLANNQKFQGIGVDYGMLHEMTHHLPVGDNYTYNMGAGNGIKVPQPNNKNALFNWDNLSFMDNDHMSGPSAQFLTAPSSYNILFFWQRNPKNIKAAQDSTYPVTQVYGNYYYNQLNIKITGLAGLGVTNCNYYKEGQTIPNRPLIASTEYTSLQYINNECLLSLSAVQQNSSFPGSYIGLMQNSNTFPIYLPRNLFETLYWANYTQIPSNFTFTIKATSQLQKALNYFSGRIQSGIGDIPMSPSKLRNYMLTATPATIPTPAIGYGTIDNLNNQYILEYLYPALPTISPSPTPIRTPAPTPPSNACTAPAFFIAQVPSPYSFSKGCLKIGSKMYTNDSRFTFFNLPKYLTDIPFIIPGNTPEKDDKTLSWSVSLTRQADIYIMYRKIPGQTIPTWMQQKYTRITPEGFVNLPEFTLRKNELGLIGVYDVYKYNSPSIQGTINFGPASDNTVNAYSMYLVGLSPR
jgi:hypothetical protein